MSPRLSSFRCHIWINVGGFPICIENKDKELSLPTFHHCAQHSMKDKRGCPVEGPDGHLTVSPPHSNRFQEGEGGKKKIAQNGK